MDFYVIMSKRKYEWRTVMERYEKEKLEVIEWLAHPNELGSEPYKIEFVKEFTDEEEFNCLIFKYKKSALSPWLLAISGDAGIFSEMLKYNEATAIEDAKELMNYLKDYWKSVARSEEEKEERETNADGFIGFALMEETVCDYEEFEEIFAKDWGIVLTEEVNNGAADGGQDLDNENEDIEQDIDNSKSDDFERNASDDNFESDASDNDNFESDDLDDEEDCEEDECIDAKVYAVGPLRLILGYMDCSIPDGEAEYHAQFNYMWKGAVDAAKKHKAHMLVTVLCDGSAVEKGILFAKAIASLCKMNNVIGIYENRVVYEPEFLISASEMIKDGMIPLFNLVWFGLQRTENGVSAYTYGMRSFGRDEMEIIDSREKVSDVRDMLVNLAAYVIREDVILYDGDTIGFKPGEKINLKMSEGVNVDGDSLKIAISK